MILLIFLKRREITIFLPHGHMLSYLTNVCDECLSVLAHLQLQCIDRVIIPRALQMRPCVSPEISEEEKDMWVWKGVGGNEMSHLWVAWRTISQSILPIQWCCTDSATTQGRIKRITGNQLLNILLRIPTQCRAKYTVCLNSWKNLNNLPFYFLLCLPVFSVTKDRSSWLSCSLRNVTPPTHQDH